MTRLLFLLLLMSNTLFAQTIVKLDNNTHPYVIIDNNPTDLNCFIINNEKIKSVDVLKNENATDSYGEVGKNGVIVITTIAGTNLIRLQKVLDKYKVADSLRTLKVCINNILIRRPDLILIEEQEIEGVQITDEIIGADFTYNKENYLNIITKKKDKNGL